MTDGEAGRLRRRRSVFLLLVATFTAGFLGLAWHVLAGGGWTGWEVAILLCLALQAPWLALSAATGVVGIAVRLFARDPVATVLPGVAGTTGAISTRTVIAICVRQEDMAAVLPPAAALLADLRDGPDGDRFALAILSDTPPGTAAEAEAAAVARLAARVPPGALVYRRRDDNAGFKAGNLMNFLDSDAAPGVDFVLVLDADSTMAAASVRRLVGIMQGDARLAILQPTVAGRGADTVFARQFGFGHRQAVRIWATGQAWWQGPAGPYWGHNALIRIAAFRAHARLPTLPDGSHVLSHDHVEAALLHGAGWAVRVLPEDAGSSERHPPDLPALFARDARWLAGNLQYRHLLRRGDLGRIGRLQMLQAMLHYLLAPFWFALLPLAALNAATGGGEGTSRGALVALLVIGAATLHLPKLAGHAEALVRGRDRPNPVRVAQELALGLLLDPIAALDRTAALLWPWRAAGWSSQVRAARGLGWGAALRRFGPHTAVGLAAAALFAAAGPFPFLVALPVFAGLVLAVPFAVWTAQPVGQAAGAGGRSHGRGPIAGPQRQSRQGR